MISTADLYDTHPDKVRVCETQFRSYGSLIAFSGPCATLAMFTDHTPVPRILQKPRLGSVPLLDDGDQVRRIGSTLRHHVPELAQMVAQGVNRLRPQADQKLADVEIHRGRLGLIALHKHGAQGGPDTASQIASATSASFFLPLHEKRDVGGRDEPDTMVQLADLPAQKRASPQASIATTQRGSWLRSNSYCSRPCAAPRARKHQPQALETHSSPDRARP